MCILCDDVHASIQFFLHAQQLLTEAQARLASMWQENARLQVCMRVWVVTAVVVVGVVGDIG